DALGMVAGVSFNGGNHWQSVVIPGVSLCSGGVYPLSFDPWVSFSPNGDIYASIIGNDFGTNKAILVSKSTDGGLTCGTPTTIFTAGRSDAVDKVSLTADPTDSRFAYLTWWRIDGNNQGSTMFTRTTDGGQTWEVAREIFDPGTQNQAQGQQIVVLPD